jgi:hypothetical protein
MRTPGFPWGGMQVQAHFPYRSPWDSNAIQVTVRTVVTTYPQLFDVMRYRWRQIDTSPHNRKQLPSPKVIHVEKSQHCLPSFIPIFPPVASQGNTSSRVSSLWNPWCTAGLPHPGTSVLGGSAHRCCLSGGCGEPGSCSAGKGHCGPPPAAGPLGISASWSPALDRAVL